MSDDELLRAVDEAFAAAPLGHVSWADPNPERTPNEEAYSRVTDPGRYQILLGRLDGWVKALEQLGAARVERDVSAEWAERVGGRPWRADRVVPLRDGTLPIIVGRQSYEDVLDTGVVLGCGDPVIEIERFPDCGCDACDSGSQDLLDHLDRYLLSIVTGQFRLLHRRSQIVVTLADGRSGARGLPERLNMKDVLADSTGFQEHTGPAWLPPFR